MGKQELTAIPPKLQPTSARQECRKGKGGDADSCSSAVVSTFPSGTCRAECFPEFYNSVRILRSSKICFSATFAMGCNLRPLLKAHISHSIAGVSKDALNRGHLHLYCASIVSGEIAPSHSHHVIPGDCQLCYTHPWPQQSV